MASAAKISHVFQPRATRLTTIFLTARLTTASHDHLCRVRDLSTGGLKMETLADVDVGEPIDVELKNGRTMHGEVVWVRQHEAGVRFEAPAVIADLLAPVRMPGSTRGMRILRSPRLSARCPIALRHNGRVNSAILTDISQGGAKLQTAGSMKAEDYVVLIVPGLDPRHAVVRWVAADGVGLAFVDKLGFGELSRWLASPERFAPTTVPVVNPRPQSS